MTILSSMQTRPTPQGTLLPSWDLDEEYEEKASRPGKVLRLFPNMDFTGRQKFVGF